MPAKTCILHWMKNSQEYGEKLMTNKKGSIVAIEPSTGEILCLITSPGYDPNLLVGISGKRITPHWSWIPFISLYLTGP